MSRAQSNIRQAAAAERNQQSQQEAVERYWRREDARVPLANRLRDLARLVREGRATRDERAELDELWGRVAELRGLP